jgi:putative PIN family toxin of toxin-antitoxin system
MSPRVVLDANIYVSALISEKGNPARIIRAWRGEAIEIAFSQPVIDEILRVTNYERIQRKYAKVRENRLNFVELLSEQCVWVEPAKGLDVVKADESDNRYIECAVASGAQYIVTGDDHLLELKNYLGIEIITPAAFIILLELQNNH